MACAREDRIDGIPVGLLEVVSLEMPVILEMANDGPEFVPEIAAVSLGAFDLCAGQLGKLINLARQGEVFQVI